MVKLNIQQYSKCISFANDCKCGTVYPLSIAQHYQNGDIFANAKTEFKTILFWHDCGFAFVSGEYNENFLEDVYDFILDREDADNRRFILFIDDERIKQFFLCKEGIEMEHRYFFEYNREKNNGSVTIPKKFELKTLDTEILSKIKGRITPSFSWTNAEDFLLKGKGYCILDDDNVAAWAFCNCIKSHGSVCVRGRKKTGMGLSLSKFSFCKVGRKNWI